MHEGYESFYVQGIQTLEDDSSHITHAKGWPIPDAVSVPHGIAAPPAFERGWDFEAEVARLHLPVEGLAATAELPPRALRPSNGPSHRRRNPAPSRQAAEAHRLGWLSRVLVTATFVLVAAISVLGGLATLEPFRHGAGGSRDDGASLWWPVLVHGPWAVASLSILRASIHHRRALHSWIVLSTFTGLSMALSVADAPRSVHGVVVAVLPAIAITACLHQLVRQITLTRPPQRFVQRQRRGTHV